MFHCNPNVTANASEKAFCERYPLHKACRDGEFQTLALFLTNDRQKLLEEDSFYGWTPLHWAAFSGKLECLSKLMNLAESFNFDIDSSRFSQTPLHIVAFKGHLHCLQWLLQVGANSNKQDHLGETPLHKAARTGNMECLSLLSSAGANILILNNNGLTASNLAALAGNVEASEYLKQMEDCHPNVNGFRNNFDKNAFLNGSFNEKDFIKQGLNGGHLPESVNWNGIYQHNGIPANGHSEIPVNHLQKQNPQSNGFCSINGMNGHAKNGFSFPQPMMGGCKRPYEDRIQEEVKRIRTVEDINEVKYIGKSIQEMRRNDIGKDTIGLSKIEKSVSFIPNEDKFKNPCKSKCNVVITTDEHQLLADLLFRTHGECIHQSYF